MGLLTQPAQDLVGTLLLYPRYPHLPLLLK